MVSVSILAPSEVGVKVTVTVRLSPGAIVVSGGTGGEILNWSEATERSDMVNPAAPVFLM